MRLDLTVAMQRTFAAACAALALAAFAAAMAATPLDTWRAEVTRVRLLAENDVRRAYEEARRLHGAMPADATPVDVARSLNVLSRIETYYALAEPAEAHAKQAFAVATQNNDRIGQAESDLNMALNSISQGKLGDLVSATQHSVGALEGINRPDLLSEALLGTAVMHRHFEQLDDSIAVAVQAMEIARRSGNPLALTHAHLGLAIALELSTRPDETHEHYQQMRQQAKAANSRLLEGFAIAGLASVAGARHDPRLSEQLGHEAVAMFREIGAPYAVCFGLYGLAYRLIEDGRAADAIPLLNESVATFERFPNRIGRWFALNARGRAYQALGETARAEADAQTAYAIAKDLGYAIYTSRSANRLSSIAAAKGDHKKAYELAVEAAEQTARAVREKVTSRMLQLIKRYETEGRQREIDELTRRNEQQTAQLHQRQLQQRWLLTLLAAVALGLAGVALFVHRLRMLNASLEQRVHERTSQLRQQARYVRALIDILPMWAWFKDTLNRYVVVNESHAKGRGRTVDEMLGKSDLQLLPPDAARQLLADDEEVMRTGVGKASQEWVLQGGGGVWMETYKAPVVDDDGTVLGTVGVARNISERKAVETAREAALAEATQLARMRSEFLAQMSHELRTPLNGILGFARILQRDKSLTQRQVRGLKIIDESGQHLLALINDILDLARIDAAKLELIPTDVDLHTLLQVVCDIVRVKAEEKNLLFTFNSEGALPAVRVDEKRLRQVLLNLLSNAIKFTDKGRVTLRASSVPGADDGHARLRFEVEDRGVGMDREQVGRLFQPFEQVGDARRREGGTGLGLAISRQLVRLMGGDIEVRSTPGEGSLFCFEIVAPLAIEHVPGPAERRAPIGYQGERRKVLVVDDVPQNCDMLTEVMTTLGFVATEAGNGEEALASVSQFHPDLVLMDLSMPVMDGFEAIRRLRADPLTRTLPILATSASARGDTAARCREAGADAFIAKPIDQDALVQAVGRLLKLQWVYDGPSVSHEPALDQADGELVPPPPEEIAVLMDLARVGNMRSIAERADHVTSLDPRYAAFGSRLRSLAEACQSRAIALLVERYSGPP